MSVKIYDLGNHTGVEVNEKKIRNLIKQIGEEFTNKGYIIEFTINVLGNVKDLKLNNSLKS